MSGKKKLIHNKLHVKRNDHEGKRLHHFIFTNYQVENCDLYIILSQNSQEESTTYLGHESLFSDLDICKMKYQHEIFVEDIELSSENCIIVTVALITENVTDEYPSPSQKLDVSK